MPSKGGCLRMPRQLYAQIRDAAHRAMPNEICGLMAGQGDTVSKLYFLTNSCPSPVSYSLDPTEQLRTMREIEAEGLKMLGIFHSHPVSPPVPSAMDVSLAMFPGTEEPNYPDAAYLIVSLALMKEYPEAAAYLIEKGSVEPLELCIFEA